MSEKKKSRIRKWSENIIKRTIKTTAGTVKNTVSKVSTLDQKINKNDVSDTGAETIRFANSNIKTVKKSIKTTKRTIKTTKNTIKKTGSAVYRTTTFAVKSTVAVSKFVGNVAINIAAFLMNPVVIFLAVIIIIFVMMASFVVILLGGGAGASSSNRHAYSSAVGLVDIAEQYQKGVEYLNNAIENHQNNFNLLIDSMYYDYEDLTHSDLVYMERTLPSPTVKYETSFAVDDRKNALKSEWNILLTEREIISIAYVYLENQKNASKHTEHGIYEISFNQEVFDTIISKCAAYSDNIYNNQKCPDENCTRHVEMIPNPEYDDLYDQVNNLADAYNSWAEVASTLYDNSQIEDSNAQSAHWNVVVQPMINTWIVTYNRYPTTDNDGYDFLDVLGSEYEDVNNQLNNTPPEIEEVTYICENQHNLHSVGLAFFDKETVMNALNFDDISKQWVELTETGFENNPDIS